MAKRLIKVCRKCDQYKSWDFNDSETKEYVKAYGCELEEAVGYWTKYYYWSMEAPPSKCPYMMEHMVVTNRKRT